MNRVILFLFLGAALLVSGSVSAQVNVVTIANGDVAGLKAALTAANSNGEADIINLAANGTYTLTTPDNSTNGATGFPVIGPDSGHSVAIHGHGATIIRSGSTPFRILELAPGSNVSIDNLTINHGLVANFASTTTYGAGIYNNGGTLALTICFFDSNSVQGTNGGDGISLEPNGNPGLDGYGGAIASLDSGVLTVTGCTFTNNSALGGRGGNGFGNGQAGNAGNGTGGAIYTDRQLAITGCTFSNNSAAGGNGGNGFGSGAAGNGANGSGGAIFGAATATVISSTFSGNSCTAGAVGSGPTGQAGGTFAHSGQATGGALIGFGTVQKSSFTNNFATPAPNEPSGGGALDFSGTISESSFTNNSASSGAAIFLPSSFADTGQITATVSGCLFQNDSASDVGGACYIDVLDLGPLGVYPANLAMTNCTISACSALDGAAIYNTGMASLINCTVDGNNSSESGAGALGGFSIDSFSPIGLTNSILKTGTTGASVASGGIISHGHNISNDNAAGLLTATGDKPNTDPFFVSDIPQDNGGPTKTIAIGLFDSSPAINAGDDSVAPHRDQRGYFRTGRSDIGAYEYFGGLTGSSSIARSGNDAIISAEVVYGHSYQLERKLNLTDANWTPIGNEFVAANNDIESATASGDISLGHAFYHIRFTN